MKSRRPLKTILFVVLAVVLCIAGYGTLSLSRIERLKAEARKLGVKLEPKDMEHPAPPDSENAARFFEAAHRELALVPPTTRARARELPALATGTATDRAAAKADLKLFAAVIAEIERAGALDQCRFDLDYAKGLALLFPFHSSSRDMVRILTSRGLIRCAEGDVERGFADFLLAARLIGHLRSDVVVIPQLVGAACEGLLLESLSKAIAVSPATDGTVVHAREVLDALSPYDPRATVLNESIFYWQSADQVDQVLAPSLSDPFIEMMLRTSLGKNSTRTGILSYWVNAYKAFPPEKPPLKAAEDLEKLSQRISASWAPSNKIMMHLVPDRRQVIEGLVKANARQAAFWNALDAFQLYGKGAGITSLSAAHVDPFTDKPMRLKIAKTIVAYSVGKDRRDDGGDRKKDVVVSLPLKRFAK